MEATNKEFNEAEYIEKTIASKRKEVAELIAKYDTNGQGVKAVLNALQDCAYILKYEYGLHTTATFTDGDGMSQDTLNFEM